MHVYVCILVWSACMGGVGSVRVAHSTYTYCTCVTGLYHIRIPHTYKRDMSQVTCVYVTCYPVRCTPSSITDPLHSKLHPLEVHNADGPIATLPNTPLHSLPGGEGQEGPLLKGSNVLCGGRMLKIIHTATHDEAPPP